MDPTPDDSIELTKLTQFNRDQNMAGSVRRPIENIPSCRKEIDDST